MTGFAARIARAKPGSLLADGSVIDWSGKPQTRAAFVPYGLGVRDGLHVGRLAARNAVFNQAGWRTCPVTHSAYPGIPPNYRVFAIVNINTVEQRK